VSKIRYDSGTRARACLEPRHLYISRVSRPDVSATTHKTSCQGEHSEPGARSTVRAPLQQHRATASAPNSFVRLVWRPQHRESRLAQLWQACGKAQSTLSNPGSGLLAQ